MPVPLLTVILAVTSVVMLASGIVRGSRRRAAVGIVGVLSTLLMILSLGTSLSAT